jgi:peptidoglycan/xylan/chitin deacetylase (PgdA/CDA1 family)
VTTDGHSSGWLGRFLKLGAEKGHGEELRVDRPTLTFSFDYEGGLAFDDPELADQGLDYVLDALARRKLRATFNCIAALAESAADRLRAIADAGHEVACHGYMHGSPRDLNDLELRQTLFRAREMMERNGLRPIGFRSPRSRWDDRVYVGLARVGFGYNSEHDKSHFPYVLQRNPAPLMRMPIATDDWGYVKYPSQPERVPDRHYRYLRRAVANGYFLALGYHPWVLAEDARRLKDWESLVDLAIRSGLRICPFQDLLPEAYRGRSSPGDIPT